MAKKAKQSALPKAGVADKKRRTREHVIADLSVNHVERLALRCGVVVQRPAPDYGYDLRLETFNDEGAIENEHVPLQLKATEKIEQYELAREESFSFPISAKDYRLWNEALMPVFLILYDAVMDEAYWLHVQAYDSTNKPTLKGNTINIRIPQNQVLGVQTIRMMRRRKNECVERIRNA